jgi:hypothetical protein
MLGDDGEEHHLGDHADNLLHNTDSDAHDDEVAGRPPERPLREGERPLDGGHHAQALDRTDLVDVGGLHEHDAGAHAEDQDS